MENNLLPSTFLPPKSNYSTGHDIHTNFTEKLWVCASPLKEKQEKIFLKRQSSSFQGEVIVNY